MELPRIPLDWCGFQGSMFDVSTITGVVAREVGNFLATESTEDTERGWGEEKSVRCCMFELWEHVEQAGPTGCLASVFAP